MRKYAYGFWGISILYFVIYIMFDALKEAVNNNAWLSTFHGLMGVAVILGLFFVIVNSVRWLFFNKK